MSSTYSSRRSSFAELPTVVQQFSKSVPETPARSHHRPIFRTVPDTPKISRPGSDENGFDMDILTHKLQLYQLELEEANLRFRQKRKMKAKQEEDVAAAARFKDGLENLDTNEIIMAAGDMSQHSRSTSIRRTGLVNARRNLPAPPSTSLVRANKPHALLLSVASIAPQGIKSATLPVRRQRDSDMQGTNEKRHWRRTTISAGRGAGSKIIMMSSTGGSDECDFEVPPVPHLSGSISATASPSIISPMTPMPLEDQIRREMETFALQEGPDVQLSQRSSFVSRRRLEGLPSVYVPDIEDRMDSDITPPPEMPKVFAEVPEDFVWRDPGKQTPTFTRKKSFLSWFERKNDVDALLDLYMTDKQLVEEKELKRKFAKPRRQTFFKTFQSSESRFGNSEKHG